MSLAMPAISAGWLPFWMALSTASAWQSPRQASDSPLRTCTLATRGRVSLGRGGQSDPLVLLSLIYANQVMLQTTTYIVQHLLVPSQRHHMRLQMAGK